MAKFIKYADQNILDYILTYYGNVKDLLKFMGDNGITNFRDFQYKTRIDNVNPLPSPVTNYFKANGIIVNTGIEKVVLADFNIDFNSDFSI